MSSDEEIGSDEEHIRVEEFEVSGDEVIAKIRELVHEGNVRRISLQDKDGKTLIEVPLTIGVAAGVAGVLVAPVLAAIGAIAALVARLKIVVERVEQV
ncbi:MAG: DUF4342 domain-containing protein [Candidatus Bathyarchaeota archaeon]|nr:MAG: DUF4342 domain-containing protein [Candidatus Bathyarchaeota archaeon]